MSQLEDAYGVTIGAPYHEEGRSVSPLNYLPEVQEKLNHPSSVKVHDVTLRDGEQTARIAFTPEEKVFIAEQLNALGVYSIEPCLPVTAEDKEVLKELAGKGFNSKIVPLVRLKEEDVAATLDAKADGMLLEFGINPYLLKYVYQITPETLIDMVSTFAKAGREAGLYVEFMGWDAFRIPDQDYVLRIFGEIAERGGADRVTISDTFGMGHPFATYEMVRKLKQHVGVDVGFHIHNDYGLATAGALMAVARYLLKTLDGIERPAIATQLPNSKGGATTVLDLGANVDCSARHLLQFAVMGSAMVAALTGNVNPRVGLLNVGAEAIKGSAVIKEAGELMQRAAASGSINFAGNVEGDDIFKGDVDIVVCDGFVGNVALKTIEGLAAMISSFLRQEFSRNLLTRASGALAYPVLNALKQRTDHRRYNGAALLGLRGLVFKSHGSADATAFEHALDNAYDATDNQLLARVQERIANMARQVPDPPLAPPAAPAATSPGS